MAADKHILIVGAGPAGLVTALALARIGRHVMIAAPRFDAARAARDTRTIALLGPSLTLLESLGVWPALERHGTPLRGIRLIDDRGGILRAPETLFRADEAGLAAFGVNVPVAALTGVLDAAARAEARITFVETQRVVGAQVSDREITIATHEGTHLTARLVVAGDGRDSPMRRAAGIGLAEWSYPQVALVTSFAHTRPHEQISTEFHGPAGPFTTVPMAGDRSSLVWVEPPERSAALAALSDADLAHAIEQRAQSLLGAVSDIGPRAAFPLKGAMPHVIAASRVALVGEAAHVFPPIGAQGLNLGLRDAAAIADCVGGADDPGAADVLAAYDAVRRTDIRTRTAGVHLLNLSLLSSLPLIHAARGIGLHVLANSAWVRRLAIDIGMARTTDLPALMRGAGPYARAATT
jgi:2-octaprenyl-6-methoxyphenol hydroxylase